MRRPLLAAAALCAFHAVLALLWLSGNDLPLGARDEFMMVERCTDFVFNVRRGDFGGAWAVLREAYYPPGSRLAGIAALLVGGGYRAMVVAHVLAWAPLLVAGTLLAARPSGRWAGVAALALLLGGPSTLDGLHRFEPNFSQMAATALALACWLRCDDFRDRRWSLAFGGALAVGLMSDRLGTVPFAAAPVLLSLWRARGEALAGVLRAGALAAGLVVWWYVFFVGELVREIVPQLTAGEMGRDAVVTEAMVRWPFSWLQELIRIPDTHLGLFGGVLALIALAAALPRWRDRRVADLLVWILPGLLLFTVVPKHQSYYTMPLLPALCVLTVHVARGWGNAGRAAALVVLALCQLPAVFTVREELLDLPRGMASWALLGMSPLPSEVIGERYPVGDPPRDSLLGLQDRLAELELGPDEELVVFASDAMIAESFLVSLSRIERGTLAVHGVVLHPGSVRELADPRAFLFVTPTPAWPDDDLIRQAFLDRLDDTDPSQVVEAAAGWASDVAPVGAVELASGGYAVTWRRP